LNFRSNDKELEREESQGDSITKEGHVSEKDGAFVALDLPEQSPIRGEQSSVITEITDQKPKPEPKPNCSSSVRFRFFVSKTELDQTEPNLLPYISPHPNSI